MNIKLFLVLGFVYFVVARNGNRARFKGDALMKTRCDLACWDMAKPEKSACRNQCKSNMSKPGTCSTANSSNPWSSACVQTCSMDTHCDSTQKCCSLGCGTACAEPTDLLDWPGLPAMPVVNNVTEKRRSTQITWTGGVGDAARAVPGRVLFIVEEQHHLGPKYEAARLGEWSPLLRTNRTKSSLRNLLKPGRWYRFRVAAVNAAGTRGYSDPSVPFTVRRGPRPPSTPRKLRVRRLRVDPDSGNVTIRLEWKAARSDLPVSRYKVFWSRRVRGLDGDLDSVLVNHQSVEKDQNFVDIPNLLSNSMYYLEAQTISQFGTSKLRSEKTAIFFNTTGTNSGDNTGTSLPEPELETSESRPQPRQRPQRITGVRLAKVIWHNNKIKARITWDKMPAVNGRAERYQVKWVQDQCGRRPTVNSGKELVATTEQNTFELYELNYDCKYRVFINRSPVRNRTPPEGILTFTVPSCRQFQQRSNTSLGITCP